ncbi:carboxylesterase/lipase family protein [Amycolatopsis jejuensis]|uniref:carboxylesterase/lipase family protein n=1 Tax=Amycolatopsis jejuensis TaxID=330084 RepID=UPI00068C9C1A|nr:carboxylesterase family protein [Amycolatopsis jejuensis]
MNDAVETTSGSVRGIAAPGVTAFLGIPYADSSRFAPPRPRKPWTGTLDATAFGTASPQNDPPPGAEYYQVLRLCYPGVPTPLEGRPSGEDCQYLNVWTPGQGKRPVMVWLHGGAFVHGTGAEGWFQGDQLAAHEDVVVVTLNHRLGLLGFLGPADHEVSGIAGMLDIVEALRWVRDNIAAFGGDPGNVTVFGQSGGGAKVLALLAMPAAQGLFHRVIVQSVPTADAVSPEDAARVRWAVEMLLTAAGTNLHDAPVPALLAAQKAVLRENGVLSLGPVLHPVELPQHPFRCSAPEQAATIPMLIGTTTHEFALMLAENSWYHQLSRADLPARFDTLFPENGDGELDRYSALEAGEPPQLVLARAASDITFRAASDHVRARKAAQKAPVYSYRLDYRTEVLNGILGAHHSLDLALVFRNADRAPITGQRPERFAVSRMMSAAWASFARSGAAEWQPFTAEAPEQMVFDAVPQLELDVPVQLPDSALAI